MSPGKFKREAALFSQIYRVLSLVAQNPPKLVCVCMHSPRTA